MSKKLLFTLAALAVAFSAFAFEVPKGLKDSTPDQSILVTLDQYYAKRALPDKPVIDIDKIYSSPRSQVELRTIIKGTTAGPHFHATADEIVLIVGGSGELFINGAWTPVKKGDLHVNPRGCVHGTRALTENMQFISIYTPQLPPGGDANPVNP